MIESKHFFVALHVLSEVLPYQKQLSPETRNALWELFPPEAKRDLTPADLQWAVAQRLIDPDPPKDTAISSVLIHYLYPKRDGWPALDAGPRRLDPRTAVRDEQKVFRAGVDGSALPTLNGRPWSQPWPARRAKDGGEPPVLTDAQAHAMAQSAQGEALHEQREALKQLIDQAANKAATLSAQRQQAFVEAYIQKPTPIHSGGEGPDGPTPPIWTDPNWMGGSRRG